MSENTTPRQLTLFAAAAPVRTYPSPETGQDWQEPEADFSMNTSGLSANCARLLRFGRTSPAHSHLTLDAISRSSSVRFTTSGRVTSHGACLMLNTSDSPNDASECLLSSILEDSVPEKYFLSRKALQGIERRAKNRGQILPMHLQAAISALTQVTTRHSSGYRKSHTPLNRDCDQHRMMVRGKRSSGYRQKRGR